MRPLPASTHPNTDPIILSVAFPYAPVGAEAVGGAEVVLSQIEAALPTLGFRSAVVADAASRPQGRLYPVQVPPGEITPTLRLQVEIAMQAAIDRALATEPVALVHFHGLDFDRYRLPAHIPALVTLHLPPTWYPESIWNLPSNYQLLCVSETQLRLCPPAVRDRLLIIPNGVPLPDSTTLRPAGRYALMLARICAEKNLHIGLDAAKLAGMPALLAGEVFPYASHEQYFRAEIAPRLTGAGMSHDARAHAHPSESDPVARFLGPVTGAAKAKLLARAACLLLPSLASETSSLVAMEALAAGVPVVAMASGAVPEIVDHGRTGFLIDPHLAPEAATRSMAAAIREVSTLDRRACRAAAEQQFGLHRTLDAYADLYRRFAKPPARNPTPHLPAAEIGGERLAPPALVLDLVTAPGSFASLWHSWEQLWRADPRSTPFQHPAWLLPWWRQFGPEGELHAVLLRDPSRPSPHNLLGLLPTYIYPILSTGQRKLLLVGAGTTDVLDGLFHPAANPTALAAAALRFLQENTLAWPGLNLTQLRPESRLLQAAGASDLAAHLVVGQAEPCAIISLAVSTPAKAANNARRYRRLAQAQGQLALATAETAAEALASFEALVQLHTGRWHSRGESGVLADPRVLAHHREAIPALLAAGLLRLFQLTLNNDPLGVLYALADPPGRPSRSLYLYLIGIETRFAALSPGTLLLQAIIEQARTEEFAYLNLLRGGEAYKRLWGASAEPTYSLLARPESA